MKIQKELQDIYNSFTKTIPGFIKFQIVTKLLFATLLLPVFWGGTQYLIYRQGQSAITNSQLLQFLLSPQDVSIKAPHNMVLKNFTLSNATKAIELPFTVEKLEIKGDAKVKIFDEKQILSKTDKANVVKVDSTTSATKSSKPSESPGSSSGTNYEKPKEVIKPYYKDEKNYGPWELAKENFVTESTLTWDEKTKTVDDYVSLKLVNTNADFSKKYINKQTL